MRESEDNLQTEIYKLSKIITEYCLTISNEKELNCLNLKEGTNKK
jgi:phosphatidate phosphatase PAH1